MQSIQNRLQAILNSPADECRPYPFWFWNGELTDAEITWQLEECRLQRIVTVLIHPRHGLVTPYLGDDYFARIVHTVNECKRLGMKVWLYDEYNWPSGPVAGRVLRDYPQYRMRFLNFDYREHDGGTTLSAKEALSADFPALHAVELATGERRTFAPGETLPAGRWGVAEFHLKEPAIFLDAVIGHSHTAPLSGYLDVMNPDAVAKFIEMTHCEYERHLKEHFGTTVLGFFTDEPGLIYDFTYDYDFGHGMTHNVPWTADFDKRFAQAKGYSIGDRLMDLMVDTPHAAETRKDFWDVISQFYGRAYHAQLSQWCQKRSLAYTGHVCCEEMPLHYQGDLHESLRHFHIPGTDWTSRDCTLDTASVYMTGKIVSSVSHRYGRPFTMCETYGASGWALTLSDMRCVVDYLYALGINQMCLHGFFYSVRAARAHECPPSEFFQAPSWKYMSHYSDYTARLGALLTQGRHGASVGLLWPTRSYQARNVRTWIDADDPCAKHANALSGIFRTMIEWGIDFDVIFDSGLTETTIDKNAILWGDERIDTLIVPPSEPLDAMYESILERFQRAGGRVIRLADASDVSRCTLRETLFDRRIVLRNNRTEMPGVLVHHRQLDDGSTLCFVCNATNDARELSELSLPGRAYVCEIDVEQAKFAACNYVQQGDRTVVSTTFLPHQARLFVLTSEPMIDSAGASALLNATKKSMHEMTLPTEWTIVPDRDNVYRLTSLLHIHLPDGKRSEVHARVICDAVPTKAAVLIEGDAYTSVSVNHIDVTARRKPCRYFDSDQFSVDITDHLRIGENRVSLMYSPEYEDTFISGLMTCAGIMTIEPHVFLIGDFSVTGDRHLATPTKTLHTGRWQEQGFPDYAGTITYRGECVLDAADKGATVTLSCDVAEGCVEVKVNGTLLATRLWAPYTVDLTSAMRVGANVIELAVTNTVSDLLRPWASEMELNNPQAFLSRNNRQYPDSGLQAVKVVVSR